MQLTHNVSLKATDAFWRVAVNSLDRLYNAKKRDGIKKKIPQFTHQRRMLYATVCPKVTMNFAYMHKETEATFVLNELQKAPVKTFENDTNYQKLYECAFVQVIYYI